jgi:hypothetical protein
LSWLAPAAGFNPVELPVKGKLFGSIPKPVSSLFSVHRSALSSPPQSFFISFCSPLVTVFYGIVYAVPQRLPLLREEIDNIPEINSWLGR